MRCVELQGGPLDGKSHQLKDPFGTRGEPDSIGLLVDPKELRGDKAWYERDIATEQYCFSHIEEGAD
jgi:hypothetical protein